MVSLPDGQFTTSERLLRRAVPKSFALRSDETAGDFTWSTPKPTRQLLRPQRLTTQLTLFSRGLPSTNGWINCDGRPAVLGGARFGGGSGETSDFGLKPHQEPHISFKHASHLHPQCRSAKARYSWIRRSSLGDWGTPESHGAAYSQLFQGPIAFQGFHVGSPAGFLGSTTPRDSEPRYSLSLS
jgi:hypothetical protein